MITSLVFSSISSIEKCLQFFQFTCILADYLAILPFTVNLFFLSVNVNSCSMWFALPSSCIFATVRPFKTTLSEFFIINPLADVFKTIGPREDALAFTLTVAKLSSVDCAVRILVHSLTVVFVIFILADVGAIVITFLLAYAVHLALQPLPLVRITIRHRHNTKAMIFVFKVLPFISLAIETSVDSCPVLKTILPLSFINISIGIDHPSSTIPLTVLKVSIVAFAIGPDEDTPTVNNVFALVLNPLSLVFAIINELKKTPIESLNPIVVGSVTPVKRWKSLHSIL